VIACETVFDHLKASGERLTLSRRLVIAALCQQPGHVSVSDVQARIAAGGHDLPAPTIYRVLQWLKEVRVVSQTDIGAAGVVYELVTQPCHHHLICLGCGAVIDLDDSYFAPLRASLCRDFGFAARVEHMAIFGLCPACETLSPSLADS
jgi:Fur family ferric uptake transcriptional regulator